MPYYAPIRYFSFSNIGTVGREQLITSGSNGEPNWSYIPSKGKSTKTQNEFVSEIKKMAQKAVNATDKTEQDAISRQVLQLSHTLHAIKNIGLPLSYLPAN